MFIIAFWFVLLIAALKSSLDNSDMFVISVLVSVNCLFSFKLRFFCTLLYFFMNIVIKTNYENKNKEEIEPI